MRVAARTFPNETHGIFNVPCRIPIRRVIVIGNYNKGRKKNRIKKYRIEIHENACVRQKRSEKRDAKDYASN